MADEQDILQVPFRILQHHAFDGGELEVRRYFWASSVDSTFLSMDDELILNLALTSRPERTKVGRLQSTSAPLDQEAGRLLVMMPRSPYHVIAPSGAFRSLHCALRCSKFEQLCGEPIDWDALIELGGEFKSGTKIEQLLVQMHDELVHERAARHAMIEAYANALCIELYRGFRQGRPLRPDVHIGGLATWRMRVITERVHADLPAPSVSDLASLCGLTTRQLSRAFKAETGMTIGRYVDEATIERAHRMLTSTNITIAAIARELGFASADSFAQSYRRVTGSPPSHARQGQA